MQLLSQEDFFSGGGLPPLIIYQFFRSCLSLVITSLNKVLGLSSIDNYHT